MLHLKLKHLKSVHVELTHSLDCFFYMIFGARFKRSSNIFMEVQTRAESLCTTVFKQFCFTNPTTTTVTTFSNTVKPLIVDPPNKGHNRITFL